MQIYAMGISDIEFELPTSFYLGKLAETSPIGRIPVLELDDGIIPESEVIAEYLDDLYPDKSLAGATPRKRAEIRLLSRIADIYLMNNIFMALPQIPRELPVWTPFAICLWRRLYAAWARWSVTLLMAILPQATA